MYRKINFLIEVNIIDKEEDLYTIGLVSIHSIQ